MRDGLGLIVVSGQEWSIAPLRAVFIPGMPRRDAAVSSKVSNGNNNSEAVVVLQETTTKTGVVEESDTARIRAACTPRISTRRKVAARSFVESIGTMTLTELSACGTRTESTLE